MSLAIIWDERFTNISFSHPMIRDISKERIKRFWELLKDEPGIVFVKPDLATRKDLELVHTTDYINKLEKASEDPYIGFLDSGDTTHYPGMFNDILLIVGSSITAIKYSNFFDKIYIPLGGFHHALPNQAMGFCPVNDIGIATKILLEKGERIAIVDVDAHHGNGLQYLFYNKSILKINIFAYDGKFFPGTGHYSERGLGEGKGLNYNIAMPLGSADDSFYEALRILDKVSEFNPTYIIVLAGVDGHKEDNLKSLNLTTNSFNLLGYRINRISKELHSKVISYGGGGYGNYSALCMREFVRGLKGIREKIEKDTEDIEKTKYVKRLVSLLSEGFPSSF
ncbi:histone deacetylase family protein [Acidianus brierleyi]|uniref:Acetoin utilization protein n=1 Tax=Acidianus brierleyi TaxID=41673 RepID=A0A2U9IGE2_9CREN|nr:histone deacetylase family protein [Acidianus brierleyi]AWR95108.1 histone deacetylase family protein [Acidianus brierleyi]